MKRLAWLALVVLAVAPYLPSLGAPLLYDDRTLLDNRWLVREAGPLSVFQHDYWHGTRHEGSDLYRPLTVLSLAWNMRAAPTKEGIRAVNVALHAAAVLALFVLLGRVLSSRAAWIGAALFAVHPLASEAVLWAVGRAEVASALLGTVAFVLFTSPPDGDGYGVRRAVASAAAWLAALCFKESAATWLAIGAAWVAIAPDGRRLRPRVIALRALPHAAALIVYLSLRASAIGWGRNDVPFIDNPLADADEATRAANAILLFVRYVGKMLVPRTLSLEYGFDQIGVVPFFPWGVLGAAAIAGAVLAAVVTLYRRGLRTPAFLAAFVPCGFAVTGNLGFPIGTIFAERLAYTSLLGACGLAGWALAAIPHRAVRPIVAGALIAACGARTIVRGGDYRSLAVLSEATAEASPRAVKALANAGRTRLRQGDAAGAREQLARAVAIWPDYASAWRLLAEACDAQQDAACAADARARAAAATSETLPGHEPL